MKRAVRIILALGLLLPLMLIDGHPRAASAVSGYDTLLPNNSSPTTGDAGTTSPIEIGTWLQVRRPGAVVGLRFWKSASNTGVHVGKLWSQLATAGDPALDTVTFTGETASGWQEAYFSSPHTFNVGEQFAISYNAPNGHYAKDLNYFQNFTSTLDFNLAEGGYYSTPGNVPNENISDSNYWVDPIWAPTAHADCPCSMMSGYTPSNIDSNDATGYELGTRFSTYEPGNITGVRFYKATTNTGVHTGHLWDNDGNLLATVTFAGETASGWQTAYFSSPVYIEPFTSYVVSYADPNGHYSYEAHYYDNPRDDLPFHEPSSAGLFIATPGSFPTGNWNGNNYAVDAVFNPSTTETVSATVDPSMLFSVAGRSSTCNGQSASNFQTGSTATAVSLGHLSAATVAGGAQDLTVNTNAAGGFTVAIRTSGATPHSLRDGASHSIADVSGTAASPGAAPAAGTAGFGYTTSDTATAFTSDTWAKLTNANDQVLVGSSGTFSKSACVGFEAAAALTTPAGLYSSNVIYTAIATF